MSLERAIWMDAAAATSCMGCGRSLVGAPAAARRNCDGCGLVYCTESCLAGDARCRICRRFDRVVASQPPSSATLKLSSAAEGSAPRSVSPHRGAATAATGLRSNGTTRSGMLQARAAPAAQRSVSPTASRTSAASSRLHTLIAAHFAAGDQWAPPADVPITVEWWENQRLAEGSWGTHCLPDDPPPCSDATGRDARGAAEAEADAPCATHVFDTPWAVDAASEPCDAGGWRYAMHFDDVFTSPTPRPTDMVRRRRFVRTARPKTRDEMLMPMPILELRAEERQRWLPIVGFGKSNADDEGTSGTFVPAPPFVERAADGQMPRAGSAAGATTTSNAELGSLDELTAELPPQYLWRTPWHVAAGPTPRPTDANMHEDLSRTGTTLAMQRAAYAAIRMGGWRYASGFGAEDTAFERRVTDFVRWRVWRRVAVRRDGIGEPLLPPRMMPFVVRRLGVSLPPDYWRPPGLSVAEPAAAAAAHDESTMSETGGAVVDLGATLEGDAALDRILNLQSEHPAAEAPPAPPAAPEPVVAAAPPPAVVSEPTPPPPLPPPPTVVVVPPAEEEAPPSRTAAPRRPSNPALPDRFKKPTSSKCCVLA